MPPAKGRRNPALLQPDGDAGPQIDLAEQHHDEGEAPDEVQFLFPGDIVTVSLTMPVILAGTGKETYIGAKATTRVQDDEVGPDATNRARVVVIASIFEGIDEAEETLARYAEEVTSRQARVSRELNR